MKGIHLSLTLIEPCGRDIGLPFLMAFGEFSYPSPAGSLGFKCAVSGAAAGAELPLEIFSKSEALASAWK
jgi:hypothetical protein